VSKRIVVIGGGFGGLAAANRLAAKGHQVTLFEKRDKLGGRGYQYEINGFKFDGGPTVITAPYVFDEVFAGSRQEARGLLSACAARPFYRIFDHEGRHFDYWHSLEDAAAEVERWNPADKRATTSSRSRSRRSSGLLPVHRSALSTGPQHAQDHAHGHRPAGLSWHPWLRRPATSKTNSCVAIYSFHPLLIGGNPFDTPAIYTLIGQVEKEWGVHYALGARAPSSTRSDGSWPNRGHGPPVDRGPRDPVHGRRVTGVRLADGSEHQADAIVCNGDVAFAYRHLIPAWHRRKYTDARIDRMQYSMSLFVIYFGTRRRYLDSKLQHHNVIVNRRYRGLLKDIFAAKGCPTTFPLPAHALQDRSVHRAGGL
jgi:phytoene desaturase